MLCYYYDLFPEFEKKIENTYNQVKEKIVNLFAASDEEGDYDNDNFGKPIEEPLIEEPVIAAKSEKDYDEIFKEPRVYKEFLTTVTLIRGDYLVILARKYYGDKDFWVYIYEANKEKIKHPNTIPAGTRIAIPKLDPRLVDMCDPITMEYAKMLHNRYLGQ